MYDVNNMNHKDMVELVRRRLGKLAMCKRGSVSTDINKRIEALGPKPTSTAAQKKAAAKKVASAVRKAMTPTADEIQEVLGGYSSLYNISHKMQQRAERIISAATKNPAEDKWQRDVSRLKDQESTRQALLDQDFLDVEDTYILGIKTLDMLGDDLILLEQREW